VEGKYDQLDLDLDLERRVFQLGLVSFDQTARLLRSHRSHDQRNRRSFYVPTEVRRAKRASKEKTRRQISDDAVYVRNGGCLPLYSHRQSIDHTPIVQGG
jgi:hypothetical protein